MKILVFVSLVILSTAVFADSLKYVAMGPTEAKVASVIERISPLLLSMKGVSGVGMTACEAKSGIPFHKLSEMMIKGSSFENCVAIGASDKTSLQALERLFPDGTKFEDIYIEVSFTGKFSAQ